MKAKASEAKRRKALTHQELAALQWRYENTDQTLAEIAKAYDIHRQYVSQLARKYNWKGRYNKPTKVQDATKLLGMTAHDRRSMATDYGRAQRLADEEVKGHVVTISDWAVPVDMPANQVAMAKDPAVIQKVLDKVSSHMTVDKALHLVGLWHEDAVKAVNHFNPDWEGRLKQAIAMRLDKLGGALEIAANNGDTKTAQWLLERMKDTREDFKDTDNGAGTIQITFNLTGNPDPTKTIEH